VVQPKLHGLIQPISAPKILSFKLMVAKPPQIQPSTQTLLAVQ